MKTAIKNPTPTLYERFGRSRSIMRLTGVWHIARQLRLTSLNYTDYGEKNLVFISCSKLVSCICVSMWKLVLTGSRRMFLWFKFYWQKKLWLDFWRKKVLDETLDRQILNRRQSPLLVLPALYSFPLPASPAPTDNFWRG